jgi:outer membrane receptor protein involved in Fe transport
VRYEHVTSGATVTVNEASTKIDPEFQDWIGYGGLTYELTDQLNLVGSISEGFRAPNLDDLAAVNSNVFVGTQLPNPDLDPETSITYEVGAKLDTPRLRGQTIVWWTDLQNHILRGPPNDQLLLERTNKDSFLQGVELSGEYLLPSQWSVYGNFWYTFGRDNVDNVPLSRIPPAQGVLGLRRRWNEGRDWFDVYGWLVREQDRLSPRDLSDTRRIPAGGTPGYATVNFQIGRMISQRQRVALNVENLFDEQYRVHGSGSDGPGINALLTYELLR